jgi:hypothetical protein
MRPQLWGKISALNPEAFQNKIWGQIQLNEPELSGK